MATKLAALLDEISALSTATEKTAAKKAPAGPDKKLWDTLDKLAMELDPSVMQEGEKHEEEETKEEEKKEEDKEKDEKAKSNKEASMNETQFANKIANMVLKQLEKIAVQGGEVIPNFDQPNTASGGGTLLQAIDGEANIDQLPGSQIKDTENPNPNDLVKKEPPASYKGTEQGTAAEPLQKGASVTLSSDEAEALQKLASVGYEYLVDYYSDQIVNQKIAEAVNEERAKTAAVKIAQKIVANESAPTPTRTPAQMSAREKLAAAAERDPQVLQALQILNTKGLL